MKYQKPHLTYEEQIELLRDRGLIISNPAQAIRHLKRIGYYRLSGYLYSLRQKNHQTAHQKKLPKRLDNFIDGAQIEDGVALHDFDHKLRLALLDGLQQIEVGLRVKIGHTLGKRGALAHLDPTNLGAKANEPHSRRSSKGKKMTHYEFWRKEYDAHQENARKRRQEFVLHFIDHYNKEVPVWAAVEFMPFGCLVSLLELLEPKDQNRISRDLGIKAQEILFGWLRPLNVLRNHCAHSNRVWNRPIVFQADKLNPCMLLFPELLDHLQASPEAPVDRRRVYFHAATAAYLLRAIDPNASWGDEFVSVMKGFPEHVRKFGLSPDRSMGFTDDWDKEQLWMP